jgi:A/G-specific adenine glycosylase
MTFCAGRAAGVAADLPRKAAKPAKPVRQGVVWVAMRADGAVLLEDRPPRGLLGGMPGFPGDGWDGVGGAAPVRAAWQEVGTLRHTFTHFHLDLSVRAAVTDSEPNRGAFVPRAAFHPGTLPTLMRKVWNTATARAVEWGGTSA